MGWSSETWSREGGRGGGGFDTLILSLRKILRHSRSHKLVVTYSRRSQRRMKQEEYPWLCNASEETSRSAQGWHFRLLRTQLTIFFLVALLGSTIRVLPIDLQKPTSVLIAL